MRTPDQYRMQGPGWYETSVWYDINDAEDTNPYYLMEILRPTELLHHAENTWCMSGVVLVYWCTGVLVSSAPRFLPMFLNRP